MLIEFRVENFRSFKEEQVLSMVASADKELPENIIEAGKFRLTKAAGIWGANASGKSNLVEALRVMQDIVERSATLDVLKSIPVMPFLLDEKTKNQPSRFEVTFIHNDVRYQYGFKVSQEAVLEEWLYSYPKDRSRKLFVRTAPNKAGDSYSWSFGSHMRGRDLIKKTRPDTLFLSLAVEFNHDLLKIPYEWFRHYLRIIKAGDYRIGSMTSSMLDDKSRKDGSLQSFIVSTLRGADLGISDVIVERVEQTDTNHPSGSKVERALRQLLLSTKTPKYDVRFVHKNQETGEEQNFPMSYESDGTKRLFELLGPWLHALTYGFTIVFDELDSRLHPHLSRHLLGLIFADTVEKEAQLVFTTLDSTLLDSTLLRRDQVWFTEKDKEGASHLYSLSDYEDRHVRKGEALQRGYLAGRYGAVPYIGESRFDESEEPV